MWVQFWWNLYQQRSGYDLWRKKMNVMQRKLNERKHVNYTEVSVI